MRSAATFRAATDAAVSNPATVSKVASIGAAVVMFVAVIGVSLTLKNANVEEQVLAVKEEERTFPRLAWLMSFPDSGASYTLQLVSNVTGTHTTSNYGEWHLKEGVSVPIFPMNSPTGPFISNPTEDHAYPDRGFVLVNTHCIGFCIECGPNDYIETPHLFREGCLTTKYVTKDQNGNEMTVVGKYDKLLINKIVHLYRNPFDNVVARFKSAFNKHQLSKDDPDRLNTYTDDRDGFRRFCHDVDLKYSQDEDSNKFVEDDLLKIVKDVPCHADFFRYIQWHNNAAITARDMRRQRLIIFYESWHYRWNNTMWQISEFLRQERLQYGVDALPDPHIFSEYFTDDEFYKVGAMFEELAMSEVWQQVEHYFERPPSQMVK